MSRWVLQRGPFGCLVGWAPAHVRVLGGLPRLAIAPCTTQARSGLRLLLKQWELDVQHPKEFALAPHLDAEHAGAIHLGPTRLGWVEFA